jgi:N-acetyl-gamma-glutamyl-phosphate reductase
MTISKKRIGIVGARGHTGAELIRLIAAHPALELAYVSSRELNGQRVDAHVSEYQGDLLYSSPAHEDLPGLDADVVVLALPNGKASVCVGAFDAAGKDPVIVDLSADYRFDNQWYYGLPELTRQKWRGEKRISNPGCYATAQGCAGCSAGMFRCFRLFRCRHDAVRQEQSGKAARQLDAVRADWPYA